MQTWESANIYRSVYDPIYTPVTYIDYSIWAYGYTRSDFDFQIPEANLCSSS